DKERVVLNNIYEWDPKTDDLKPTGTPSVLKQGLAKLKGIDIESLNKELERRKAVLEWMIKENITRIEDVAKLISRYYVEPEELLEEIGVKVLMDGEV
ncbi:MAG: hypothetical protein V3V92_01300, partial [Candidatus Hydrothermarchaeales archaeon]